VDASRLLRLFLQAHFEVFHPWHDVPAESPLPAPAPTAREPRRRVAATTRRHATV
jgi:hypothetical protein